MSAELLRMATAVLTNVSTGVNTRIAALAMMGGDTRPPSIAGIWEPTTHHVGVRDELLTVGPILVLDVDSPQTGQGIPFCGVRDFVTELRIAYVVKGGDDRTTRLNAEYTMRAVEACINAQLLGPATRQTNGVLNSIAIKTCTKQTWEATKQDRFGGVLAARGLWEFQMRDLTP